LAGPKIWAGVAGLAARGDNGRDGTGGGTSRVLTDDGNRRLNPVPALLTATNGSGGRPKPYRPCFPSFPTEGVNHGATAHGTSGPFPTSSRVTVHFGVHRAEEKFNLLGPPNAADARKVFWHEALHFDLQKTLSLIIKELRFFKPRKVGQNQAEKCKL
jgi:hypothetical protein